MVIVWAHFSIMIFIFVIYLRVEYDNIIYAYMYWKMFLHLIHNKDSIQAISIRDD